MEKQKILSYYAVFDPTEEGGYNVYFPDFPGCVTCGDTLEEAQEMAKEVLELWIEELKSQKQEVPIRRYLTKPLINKVQVSLT